MYRKGDAGSRRTAFKGVPRGVAPAVRRYNKRCATTSTGQRCGWPERPWQMVSLRTPFFCTVNVNVTKVAHRNSASVHWKVLSARTGADPQLDILDAEQGARRWRRRRATQIFPRAQQQEDTKSQHLGGSNRFGERNGVCRGPDLSEYRKR